MNRTGPVLVLETDDQIRQLLRRWLSEVGYDVHLHERAADPPSMDPILVIANLPNPRSAQSLIRPLKAAYSAPILALSARFRRGLAASDEAARRLAVRKLLPKPFTRVELLAAVRETLRMEAGEGRRSSFE